MPTTKKKKKVEKVPKPIKIKKEKTEEDRSLNTMSHYIDDRLELVKQIFGSLKPKTINNLAPDFLKNKSMEDIEELCLHELLGISSKRLLSVINATKCPTDTESSSDSDVEHQEEHISLEEISSDSEEADDESSKKGKKKTLKGSTKNSKSTEPDKNGHISVLELLELQARARAIRSQLALEPVTKIEVNSDGEESKVTIKAANVESRNSSLSAAGEKENPQNSSNNSNSNVNGNGNAQTSAPPQKKRIRLKRDFLKNSAQSSNSPAFHTNSVKNPSISSDPPPVSEGTVAVDSPAPAPTPTPTTSISDASIKVEAKTKSRARTHSPSPDVIPILAEPETVYISDNSEEDISKLSKSTASAAPVSTVSVTQSKGEIDNQTEVAGAANQMENESSTETEEGEITEGDSDDGMEKQGARQEVCNNDDKIGNSISDGVEKKDAVIEIESQKNEKESITVAEQSKNNSPACEELNEDDEQNEDVISIEGGDLELVLSDNESRSVDGMQIPVKSDNNVQQQQQQQQQQLNDSDIIELDTSDEETKLSNESWQSRYLKSSKVSKVLATSRLSKRVLDKMKSSKRELKQLKKDADQLTNNSKSPQNLFVSKHEDGSIEQYKELLKINQRNS